MRILELKVMRGPSYWSIDHTRLIAMCVDLEEFEFKPSDTIPGFYQNLKTLVPSLYSHQCSPGKPGGFFERLKSGTWMGHIIEHVALELQTLAGMDCGFGRTRGSGKEGVYHVVFEYKIEDAGKFAANAAFNIIQTLAHGEKYTQLNSDINSLKEIARNTHLGPTTQAITDEAKKRGIPVYFINNKKIIQFGQGVKQKRISASITTNTSGIAIDIACDKEDTKTLLREFDIPVPEGELIYNEQELKKAIKKIGFPIVIKPLNGHHGKGATVNISDHETAYKALATAKQYENAVIAEKFVQGFDYRFLVINYKLQAVAMRTPACVVGNGTATVAELIEMVNKDPRRGNGHENILSNIVVDEKTLEMLDLKKLSLSTVIPDGEKICLKDTANLSTGGTATDVTDLVHPENIEMAEKVARIVGLDICGIDFLSTDISRPYKENGAAVIEVNAAPGFRMHLQPSEGKARNVAAPVIDMLFRSADDALIPIVAITGTNGKTTTTRLTAHIASKSGKNTGFTTTEGIYIKNKLIYSGDCSGPASAERVLKDPEVEFAVLECARGGILRAGLGFNHCNVGVVMNVSADHLGLDGIDDLEKLAKVKSVVPQTVVKDGFAVLNADDILVHDMQEDLKCNIALFSLDSKNTRIYQHTLLGGLAAVVNRGYIYIIENYEWYRVARVKDIPITMKGLAKCMVQNALAAVLASYCSGISIENIREGLTTFLPSPEMVPGRLNIFDFKKFKVMVDYAHNPAALENVGDFLKNINSHNKIGIVTGVGDRRNEDIVNMGKISAGIFDKIILRLDEDLRGRSKKEMVSLLREGLEAGGYRKPIEVFNTEEDALKAALTNIPENSFVTLCTEKVEQALNMVKKRLNELQMNKPKVKMPTMNGAAFAYNSPKAHFNNLYK